MPNQAEEGETGAVDPASHGFGLYYYSPSSLSHLLEARIKAIHMPSHTSHALQPLDVAVLKHLKTFFRDVLDAMSYVSPRALN